MKHVSSLESSAKIKLERFATWPFDVGVYITYMHFSLKFQRGPYSVSRVVSRIPARGLVIFSSYPFACFI